MEFLQKDILQELGLIEDRNLLLRLEEVYGRSKVMEMERGKRKR